MQKFKIIIAASMAAITLSSTAAVSQKPDKVIMRELTPPLQQANLNLPTASVIPTGKTFKVQFNEAQLERLYKQYATGQANVVNGKVISKEEFRRMVENSTIEKMKTAFPNGWPSAGETDSNNPQQLTITVTVTLKPDRVEIKIVVKW